VGGMTARFVYWMNVSLDGMIERAGEAGGGGDWLRITESLHREFNARAEAMTMSVEGRVIYEMMEPYWPAARFDESQPEFMREYGHIWTDMPKILVSTTRTSAEYNTEIYGQDAIARLAKLREEKDGAIGVGGASLATQLLEAGLIDELLLFVHPVVLGAGRPLFDRLPEPLQLDLVESAEFESGVGMRRLAIRPRNGRPASVVDVIETHDDDLEKARELVAVGVAEVLQHVGLDDVGVADRGAEQLPPRLGEADEHARAVVGIRRALDEPAFGELVEPVRHR
jgi:dihydrofolate reductase